LLGALGISTGNAADGRGDCLADPLLQRFFVFGVTLLTEPAIDGFIEQFRHSPVLP